MVSKERPYVIINCAASADGKIAMPDRRQVRLSSKEDFERVIGLRKWSDAILVGIGTVLSDNPRLDTKDEMSKQPDKVVLDRFLRIPKDAEVFNGGSKVYLLVGDDIDRGIDRENAEIIRCRTIDNLIDLRDALTKLREKGIERLLVEGGGEVIWSFLREGLFDEFMVYLSPVVIGGRSSPTIADGEGVRKEDEIIRLRIDRVERLGDGILIRYLKR